ncbi:MAG: hypothetical protein B7Z02_00910 [Rhodobacterales bacterium 32-67-9]|nr:MAG: hypothetical protein B7Z02_00910 [Rhodobacterales bacterium 32-67-9]
MTLADTRTDPAPRAMLILGIVVLLSAAVTLAGLPTLRDTLMRWDLGLGDSPYFLPGHALQLYLITPATALATSIFLLAPGLILSAVFGREKHAAAWLVSSLTIAILTHIVVTTAFQLATGIVAKGTTYLWLVLALNIACLAVAGLRLSAGGQHRLRLDGQGVDLWVALGLFWLCLVLFAPKFYWENFTGDGSGSLQFARLYIAKLWPFWTPEAGPIRNAPGLTMVLFVIPESWFVRLWGEWEFSVRAPLLMYLALLYPVLTQLIRTGREALPALRPADHALIVAALLLYTLANVYSGGYHVYFGDSPMPAARETLSLICFLGYALFFIEDRRWLMLATGVMTHLVIPTGGLWLLMWPAAVFLTFRPIPWARLFVAAGIVGVAGFISVILPKLIIMLGLPFPGDEFGAGNIITRLRFMTFADWSRFAFWAMPAGILPVLFLLTWPKQDRIARALTLVTLGYFLFFYLQAYRVLLHHFIPAMIPPLVVMYRSELWARHQPALRGAAAVLLALSVWLSWPREMKMHGFERVIGQHVLTEGPIFETAERGDGDRFRGFDEKALDIAHVLLGNLFKMTYGEDDPKERYYGAPLVWWYYSEFDKPEGQIVNYVLKPLDQATEVDGTLFDEKDGYGLYIRDMALYAAHAATKLPVDTGAAIYITPRTVIYGHGAKRGERFVFDIVPPIKRLLGMNGK